MKTILRRALKPAVPFLLTFAAALAVIVPILALSADDPKAALVAFFAKPFSSWWYFGNTLNMAALYILAGTGSALALRAGTFNLGGEAQIYAAALAAAIAIPETAARLSAESSLSPGVALFAGLAAAVAAGGLLGFLPGWLRAKRGTSELLSSFLLSAACVPAVDYLVVGPFRDGANNLVATRMLPESARLAPFAAPSYLNASFPAALAVALAAAFFLGRTGPGFKYRVSGTAREFAKFSGYPVGFVAAAGMTLSGALHGATGFVAVAGTWYRCHQGFSAGMGWSALAVALMAKSEPLAVIPAAFLLAWLQSASAAAMLSTRLGFDATSLIQAVIFLVVSARALPRLGIPLPRFRAKATHARTGGRP